MKTGIFGGTFDPVHHGHLRPAEAAASALGLDRVFYVPNSRSPFKGSPPGAEGAHRVAMLALALQGRRDRLISLCELGADGPSYTVDTLRLFSRRYPADELTFLLGTDALSGLARWKEPGEIVRLARLAAFVRAPYEPETVLASAELAPFRKSILILDSVRVTISSSELRRAVSRGESIAGQTTPAVEEYIFKHGLYRPDSGVQSG